MISHGLKEIAESPLISVTKLSTSENDYWKGCHQPVLLRCTVYNKESSPRDDTAWNGRNSLVPCICFGFLPANDRLVHRTCSVTSEQVFQRTSRFRELQLVTCTSKYQNYLSWNYIPKTSMVWCIYNRLVQKISNKTTVFWCLHHTSLFYH